MDDERSPVQFHLVLHRIEPGQGIRRFFSLMIERGLFGTVRLARHWGRIGTTGQELVEIHAGTLAAGQALEVSAGEAAAQISGFVTQTKKLRPRKGRASYSWPLKCSESRTSRACAAHCVKSTKY
jgi:predicted DNA-binding WGR domain protein